MLLLSRIFPRLKQKSDKGKGVTSEADLIRQGDKPPAEFNCKVILLDDSELALNVKASAKGEAVLDKVYGHLNLIEKDYFGLRFLDITNQTHWLDPTKTVGTQVKTQPPHKFYFGVKFYAADPCKLHEEITRYQFFLQLKRDILQGRLPVSFDLSAELAAYAVQSELGDYDPKRHSPGYVSEFRFIPNQTEELEARIGQLHKMLIPCPHPINLALPPNDYGDFMYVLVEAQSSGLVPAAAEYRFLDKVKWLEMYGVDLHPVQGEGNIQYFLGLTPTGIVVYRNKAKVGNYFWPRLSKITFKAKFFMIRVRDKNNDENTYAFECSSKAACKHLWKCCIEHHAFFRLTSANESYKRIGGRLFKFGSKYRYSGRTERQILTEAANRPAPQVVRRPSKRHQRRSSSEGRLETDLSHLPDPEQDPMAAPSVMLSSGSHKVAPYHRAEGYQSAPDSPRSTCSAPWLGNSKHKGGLYTSGRESPLSVRSEKMMFPKRIASGSESEGGPSARRSRAHHRYESETESEYVYEPYYNRQNRAPADYTESETEVNFQQRQRRHRKSTESLPCREAHWREMQQMREINNGPYQLRPNGSLTSMASDPTGGARRRRKRSRSPGNRKPPEELAQYFRYIDPAEEGITVEQMKEIGYEQVHVELSAKSVPATIPAAIPAGEAPPPYMEDTANKKRGRQQSQPNLRYPEAKQRSAPVENGCLRNPALVQKQQTHSAPIVKTKSMPYSSPLYCSTLPNNDQPSPVTPAESGPKHTRDDSGLGAEQDNGSLNSSSSQAQQLFYTGPDPNAPYEPQGTRGPVPAVPVPCQFGSEAPSPYTAMASYTGAQNAELYPWISTLEQLAPRMNSPAGSTSSHTVVGTGHRQIYQNHINYSPTQAHQVYAEQVCESSQHHNMASRKHAAMTASYQRYYPQYGVNYHDNHKYNQPTSVGVRQATSRSVRTHSEKMTEL
ncbi:hypothetical protein LSH36_148g02077 [Paralvinella palmiformis]|uniref:Erythrocyte membrane protein band 4.1-like 4A n=1 Tax=Paralvinella palmiformis TaxID=53620 RepID=A0AAD9N970_9ANNE|nr:hypothetical protein LSH36_148g02077 [Paralvinella palmiformis]